MPITAKPVIVPAKTLSEFWVGLFQSIGPIPGGEVKLNASLVPYNPETMEYGDPIYLDEIDVLHEVRVDPEAAQVYGRVLAYLQKKAIEQGKLEAL